MLRPQTISKFALVLVLFFSCKLWAQKLPEFQFVRDTMSIPGTDRVLQGEYLEVTLKDQHIVRLYCADDNKVYVRFIVAKNFYFDLVSTLEILSGSKTYPIKNCRQWKVSKSRGLFISEVFPNYLSTLQSEGMSALLFNQAYTKFSRNDRLKIRSMADTFRKAYLLKEKK